MRLLSGEGVFLKQCFGFAFNRVLKCADSKRIQRRRGMAGYRVLTDILDEFDLEPLSARDEPGPTTTRHE